MANAPMVFVMDDDISVRRGVQRLLRTEGYEVRVFASAAEFFAHDSPPAPDCAVVDLRMPSLSGFELHERLMASGRNIPVVFITGHGDDTLTAKAMKAGAVAFLAKPFSDTALLEAVARAVAGTPRASAGDAPWAANGNGADQAPPHVALSRSATRQLRDG